MIDEKKLIEDVLHNDGMEFVIPLRDLTVYEVAKTVQMVVDNMKEGFVNLINAQPKIRQCVVLAKHEEKWISTKEKLPNPFESVLIHLPGNSPLPTVREGYLTEEGYWISLFFHEAFTTDEVPFWMPLPEPPKDGEGQ